VLVHPQGLLLLPLTSYLLLRLAVRRFGSGGLIAGFVPFVLFVPPALKLNHFVCTEHPEIQAYVRTLFFDTSNLNARHLAQLLLNGVRAYFHSFLYTSSYSIGYLPGVNASSGPVRVANMLVALVVIYLGIVAFCVPAVALFRFRKFSRFRLGRIVLSEVLDNNPPFVIAVLITVPVLFLFLYDPAHNFYRVFYLNHFTSIAACLFVSPLSGRTAVRMAKAGRVLTGMAVVASLVANTFLFIPYLWHGYTHPSLPVGTNPSLPMGISWSQSELETEKVARLCKMDLKRGRIIVDDLTQAGVFSDPVTIPITYLRLQAEVIGVSVREAAISVKANYAILRCPYFDLLEVQPQGRIGEICCYAFK
jgi:hypothetical protein